eukprot:TRINITY_DN1845_c0_g1_i1.p1 TRINITY_DN1845_c0_g1~~TRINITY_DN1845_c0_g1_i1.p1  ORF type:complete len:104 (-),score=10.68 TRINITY_DN1845_c0_g1_i1:179-490(-)
MEGQHKLRIDFLLNQDTPNTNVNVANRSQNVSHLRNQLYLEWATMCHDSDVKRCPIENCQKIAKSRGNLRRHIEWHLKKLEENPILESEYNFVIRPNIGVGDL